jgi:hypothetical protein
MLARPITLTSIGPRPVSMISAPAMTPASRALRHLKYPSLSPAAAQYPASPKGLAIESGLTA